jgi:hypothetical protein
MKRVSAVLWLLAGAPPPPGTMRPALIVHGGGRDALGIPPNSGGQGSVYPPPREGARTAVSVYPDGSNFRIDLDVCDPATAGPGQVKPGDTVAVRVAIGGTQQPTIGPCTFAVPGDGAPVNVNLLVGADSDGDGLPDAWEQMVVANSGGAVTNISQVGPGKDLDGDGMKDDQEFWYGSFAFLAGDELRAGDLQPVGGRLAFRFLTVLNTSYRVETTPTIRTVAWTNCPVALTSSGALAAGEFLGNGDYMTVYMLPSGNPGYYRLKAK